MKEFNVNVEKIKIGPHVCEVRKPNIFEAAKIQETLLGLEESSPTQVAEKTAEILNGFGLNNEAIKLLDVGQITELTQYILGAKKD